jgi:hypothetical protein
VSGRPAQVAFISACAQARIFPRPD